MSGWELEDWALEAGKRQVRITTLREELAAAERQIGELRAERDHIANLLSEACQRNGKAGVENDTLRQRVGELVLRLGDLLQSIDGLRDGWMVRKEFTKAVKRANEVMNSESALRPSSVPAETKYLGRCNHEGTLHEETDRCVDWVPDLSEPIDSPANGRKGEPR